MRPTKILPFDSQAIREVPIRSDAVKPGLKSKLMRLFDRQFRVSSIIGTEASKLEVGEYEYIDVLVDGEERILIDIYFKSEFEIARPTSNYKTILQSLPFIYVGKFDRLKQVVSIISEATKQSLKKKGMHIPPGRKAEYMRVKWLSSYTRTTTSPIESTEQLEKQGSFECECGELDLIFGRSYSLSLEKNDSGDEKSMVVMSPWQPLAVKPKSCERGGKAVVTGLACLLWKSLFHLIL